MLYKTLSTHASSDAIELLKIESASGFPPEEVFNGYL